MLSSLRALKTPLNGIKIKAAITGINGELTDIQLCNMGWYNEEMWRMTTITGHQ
jgi:hypothetical protein